MEQSPPQVEEPETEPAAATETEHPIIKRQTGPEQAEQAEQAAAEPEQV